jgi:hypothetical protein
MWTNFIPLKKVLMTMSEIIWIKGKRIDKSFSLRTSATVMMNLSGFFI